MDVLWSKDSSIQETLYFFALLLLFFSGAYGLGINFKTSSVVFTIAAFAALPFAGLIFLPSRSFIKKRDISKPEIKELSLAAVFILIYASIFILMAYNIPSIYVGKYGQYFSYNGEIVRKNSRKSFLSRKYVVTTRRLDEPSAKHLNIYVKKGFYESALKTQWVIIAGKKNGLGKKIVAIR